MDKKRKIYLSVFSLIISAIFIALLLSFSDIDYLSNRLSNINYHYYIYAFITYIGVNFLIAFRLYYFFSLNNINDFKSSLDIGITHAMLLCVLPMRLGDVIYPLLVKKYLNKTLASSIHNLIVLRVYDFVSAAVLFLIILTFFIFVPEVNYYSYVLILLSIIVAYFILIFFNGIIKCIIKGMESLNLTKLGSKLRYFHIEHENTSKKMMLIDHSIIFFFSMARWLVSGVMLMFICSSLQLDFSLISTVFLTTGMNMAFIIPVQTIGGVGLLESVLALLLAILGQPLDIASANAISIRVLWFALPFLLGIFWFLGRKIFVKNI